MSNSSNDYKSPLPQKIVAIAAILCGLIFLFAGIAEATFFLAAFAFMLPAVWWFLHERKVKADPSAPRMERHWGKIILISVISFAVSMSLAEPATDSSDEPGTVQESETTSATLTTKTTSSSSSASVSTTRTATSSSEEPTSEVIEKAPTPEQTTEAAPDIPPVVIERCGEVGLHETGTTFYSDGTSGWSQECADKMMAQTPQQFLAPPTQNPAPASYYGSCADARAAGAAPLYAGQPGYSLDLDRDGDGVACE